MKLDALDKAILDRLQAEFPLTQRPFAHLAAAAELSEAAYLDRLQALSAAGVIREIGAVFDLHRLGYQSTLCAAQVDAAQREAVAQYLNALPEVTHNYLRNHAYNLWFTLIAPDHEAIEAILADLRREAGVASVLSLPASRTFKINVRFSASQEKGMAETPRQLAQSAVAPPVFSDAQKRLIYALSQPLPLTPAPFEQAAALAGLSQEALLEAIGDFQHRRIIRRFGARIRHRSIGIRGNGMSVWQASAGQIETMATRMMAHPAITHCYERPAFPDWPYTLYAMIHGDAEDTVRSIASAIANDFPEVPYTLLFSQKEYKKSTPRYFTEMA